MNFSRSDLLRRITAGCARLGIRYPALLAILSARGARQVLALTAATLDEPCEENRPYQLLIDVSEIVRNDAKTGIQRVVRNILLQLLRKPPFGYVIRPVYASRHEGYRNAERYRAALLGQDCGENADLPVRTRPGDIFLGLDLAAHLLPYHHRTLGEWKAGGVKLLFLMYDLFPVRHPEWFTPKRPKTFRRWLRTLAIYSDCVLCISKATADDLEKWFREQYGISGQTLPVRSFHLGTDFPTTGHLPQQAEAVSELMLRFRGHPSIMMVGTIEPRKGYAQALSAFELLWRQGSQVNLIISGKAGWRVDGVVSRLRLHPEAGVRLHWFEDADDELLLQFYGLADGFLMTSEGEGYGLPVIEAARFNKPLLLRDIPIFREIAGMEAQYFTGLEPSALAEALHNWLSLISAGTAPVPQAIKCQNWAESTEQLVLAMDLVTCRSR